jgi:hypothetical protein
MSKNASVSELRCRARWQAKQGAYRAQIAAQALRHLQAGESMSRNCTDCQGVFRIAPLTIRWCLERGFPLPRRCRKCRRARRKKRVPLDPATFITR